MTSLTFTVLDVGAEPYPVSPQLTARLRVEESTGAKVHAIALRCQVRIEPQRRRYDDGEEAGLLALFGGRDRWRDTLRPFMWMQCTTMVQGFTGSTEVDLPLPCTYDFEVTGSKYLHALRDGLIPLALLFSGSVFTRGSAGFGVERVPWDCEAAYQLPVAVWREMVELSYPHSGWIRLDRDVIEALTRFQAERGLTSFDATVTQLLDSAPDEAHPDFSDGARRTVEQSLR